MRLILNDAVKSINEIQVFDVAGRMQIVPRRKLSEANYDINVSRLGKWSILYKGENLRRF